MYAHPCHRDGAVATVTLNRPERLNAMTWPMVEGLIDFIEIFARELSALIGELAFFRPRPI
jgi:enoyl-CoA hydratase/carnithine racemase